MEKPVLCYGSQVWGFQYNNSIEVVYNSYCRQILYVRKTTNTCMVLGEYGRLHLCIRYMTNCIRYWCKLLWMRQNRYLRQCYLMLKSFNDAGRTCLATKVKQLLFEYGFGLVWISQDVGDCNLFVKAFRMRLIEYYTQRWHGHAPIPVNVIITNTLKVC